MKKCTENQKILEKILSEKQLQYVKVQMSKPESQIVGCKVRTASEEGIAGFLGDHFRMVLCVKENDSVRKINLFIKTLPLSNKPKADFIRESQFFQNEALVFKLLEEIHNVDYIKPWCTKALIYNDNVIVMPDLSIDGYKTHPTEKYFDQNHVFVTVSSLARFHATFANYYTKRFNTSGPGEFLEQYRMIVGKPIWEYSWLKAAAKLTNNILKEFSSEYKRYSQNLEDKLWKLYIEGADGASFTEDTVNVIIHKDLWANNILFQYTGDVPTNAVLIDFQLVRYAPPAFDLMSLFYLTTSRNFRQCYENEALQYYFAIFLDNLDDLTKKRLKDMNYDLEAFLALCERARLYGLAQASAILPYVLMESTTAQQNFDDPDTYLEYLTGDRSAPVLAYARKDEQYRRRQLEVCEELVDKYVRIQYHNVYLHRYFSGRFER